jgi:hypothetical protein
MSPLSCELCKKLFVPNRYTIKETAPYRKYGFTCSKCYWRIENHMPKHLPEEQFLKFFNSKPLSFFKIRKVKT